MPLPMTSKAFSFNEFSGLNLGDTRLNKRAIQVAELINDFPSFSIPQMTKSSRGKMNKELKAFYRFFQNEAITEESVMETHYNNTLEPMAAYNGKILLVFDSTFVSPGKSCEGLLTRGKGKENCVRVHYCMAISGDGKHYFGIPFFLVLSNPIQDKHPDLRDESDVWIKGAAETLELILASGKKDLLSKCIFVADRESDEYDLISFFIKNTLHYIVRSQYDRKVIFNNEDNKINGIEDHAKKHGKHYTVKTKHENSFHEVKVRRKVLRDVQIQPPLTATEKASITANIVIVKNVDENEVPQVEWRLLTSLDVDNYEESKFVIDYYEQRWKIEELNKAAKTGIRVEDRQFTDLDNFTPFLAMAFVTAWRILSLRTVAEINPKASLKEYFDNFEIKYLKKEARKDEREMKNVADAMAFIADLGGYLKNKYGRPGWSCLWCGWMRFHDRALGFKSALE